MASTKQELRHLVIANALADPSVTQEQIAKRLGVGIRTVRRVAQKLRQAIDIETLKNAYCMELQKRAPIPKRVEVLAGMLKKADSNPFATLKSIEYMDNMQGIGPKVQQPSQDGGKQPPALFQLPDNCTVSIGIEKPGTIDITPEEPDKKITSEK